MAIADQISTVQEFYISYYGRPGDPAGVQYWAERFDLSDNLDDVLAAFGASDEYTNNFGSLSNTELVENLYQQTFGRAADAEGLAFYVDLLDTEEATLGSIAKQIVDGATGDDVTILANKVTVAQTYTDAVTSLDSTYDADDIADAQAILAAVDATVASVTAGNTAATDEVTDNVPPVVVPGETFTLTTGTETVTGTTGDDTIDAVSSALSSERTLDTTDVVDGGDGVDALNVTMNTSFSGFVTDAGVSNVENINLTNNTSIARTFDATGITGATNYTVDATEAAVNLKDLAEAVSIDLQNQAENTFTVNFNDVTGSTDDVVGGTEDALTLTLTNNGTVEDTSTTATERKEVTATINDIEELTLDLVGDNVVALGANDATSITITGAGSLDMDTVSTATKTVDASAAEGALTLDVSASTATMTSIQTGAGDDTLTVDTDDLQANATIAGGEGADTLKLTSTTGNVTQLKMTGFETVELGAVGGAETVSMSDTSGVTNINVTSAVDENVDFVGTGAQDITIGMKAANSNTADTLTVDNSGMATINYTASAAVLADGTDNTAALTNSLDVSVGNATDLTVNVGEYMASASDITAAKATALTLNIASGLDDDDAELTSFAGTITAAKAETVNINATGTLGAATITAATAASVTLEATGAVTGATIAAAKATSAEITTTLASTLTLTAATLEALSVNAAKSLAITSTPATLQELTVDTSDAFSISGNMADIASVSVGGTATKSAVDLANLGDGTNDYGMTVVATGLKAGLDIGTMDVMAGNDISVTASDVTGNVVIGDMGYVDAAGNTAEDVTVTTNGTTGNVDLAAIDATKSVTIVNNSQGTFDVGIIGGNSATADVSITLDGTASAMTLVAISGDDVTVDASDAVGSITYGGTITATTSATIIGSELKANVATVALDATTNAVTASLTGGIGVDVFSVGVTNNTKALTSLDVDGGVGTADVLNLDGVGAAFTTENATITGIETLNVDMTNLVTLNASAISGQTMVVDGAAGTDILALTGTDSADTIDFATGITSTAVLFNITAGKGDDTIKLSADSDIVDTVIFSAVADNGTDTITGFESTVDFMNFDSVDTLVGVIEVDTAAAAGAIALSAAQGLIVTDDCATDFADVLTIMNAAIDTTGVITGSTIIAVDNGTDTQIYLYADDTNAAAIEADEITLLGTISDVAALAEADFVIS